MNWKQVGALVVIGSLGLSCGQFSTARGEPPDFQAYMLEVRKLGSLDRGAVGLWVGNGSDGDFANLRITPAK